MTDAIAGETGTVEENLGTERDKVDRDGTPESFRDGIRDGILRALELDLVRGGAATAGKLSVAVVLGVTGAVLTTVLFSGSSDHGHHAWHLAFCAAIWAGLLVECMAFVLLRLRTPRINLAQVGALGLVGLGLAIFAALCCPAPEYLVWWSSTATGSWTAALAGPPGSAFALGLLSASFFGVAAALLTRFRNGSQGARFPSTILFVLLLPAIFLQCIGTSVQVFLLWVVGAAMGSYLGVTGGIIIGSATGKARGAVQHLL